MIRKKPVHVRVSVKAGVKVLDLNSLFHRPTDHAIRSRYSESLRTWTEKQLGVRLPKSYIALIKKRNGGRLRMNSVVLPRKRKGVKTKRDVYSFDNLPGLDRKHSDSIVARTNLARQWELPAGLIALDGDGHWWVCLDYRRCGPRGEPVVTHYGTEALRGQKHEQFLVAKSFADLLAGLLFDAYYFVFAIDDPALAGEALRTRMRSLGCRRNYPPGAGKRERRNHPGMWKWPAYNDEYDDPAHLFVFLNGTIDDPWTLERPGTHPLLFLSVCEKDQASCVLQLVEEFGNALSLIHQPADRDLIQGR